jgi:hypothetical protein
MIHLKRTVFILALFVFLIFPQVCFGEDKQPQRIAKLTFINNDEILVSEVSLMGNYRLWKYVISRNVFIPILNRNFSDQISIDFSPGGKTILVYDRKNNFVTFRKNSKVVFRKNLTRDYQALFLNETNGKKQAFNALFITPIKVSDNSTTFSLSTESLNRIITIIFSEQHPEKYSLHQSGGLPVNQIIEPVQNIYYCHHCFIDKQEHENWDLYEYNVLRKQYSKIFDSLPEHYQLYRYSDFYGSNIRRLDNKVFFTVSNDENKIVNMDESTEIIPDKDLICYDLDLKEFIEIKKSVREFDVSKSFLVTCNPVFGYITSGYSGQLFLLSGLVTIYDRNNQCVYKEKYLLKSKFNGTSPLIPIISPDEKKIVIFRCFDNLKPIVIETSKLGKVKSQQE